MPYTHTHGSLMIHSCSDISGVYWHCWSTLWNATYMTMWTTTTSWVQEINSRHVPSRIDGSARPGCWSAVPEASLDGLGVSCLLDARQLTPQGGGGASGEASRIAVVAFISSPPWWYLGDRESPRIITKYKTDLTSGLCQEGSADATARHERICG